MENKEFEDLLSLIVANIVSIIIKQTGWKEDYALERFISSKVYKELEREETKAWHLSPLMLATLFQEGREGRLLWPEAF